MSRLVQLVVFLSALIGVPWAATEHPNGRQASAAEPTSDFDNLVSMLALVPHGEQVYVNFPMAIYVDYRAVEQAGAASSPGQYSALTAMDQKEFQKWTVAMSRVQSDPRLQADKRFKGDPLDLSPEIASEELARRMPGMTSVFSQLPKTLGVEWFAIDRVLRFGAPSDPVVILGGGPNLTETAAIRQALSENGFRLRQVRDVPVWHRFEDNEQQLEAMSPTDLLGRRSAYPFSLALGNAARIVALQGFMVGSASWAQMEAVIDALHGSTPSLADHPIIRTAAQAITDPKAFDGRLVQAVFIASHPDVEYWALRKVGPYVAESQRVQLIETVMRRKPLPPYILAVLADRQEGADEVALLALAYQDHQSAEIAAKVLAERLRDYEPVSLKGRLVESLSARIDSHVYRNTETRTSVAVVGLAHAPTPDPAIGRKKPGRLFKILQSGFLDYDIDPLIVKLD